ncbi:MAG: hypothetical protein HOV94_17920, partial [Saccharothrix sp.]|nr:hypothetical protein [Saccharothrix sp.]
MTGDGQVDQARAGTPARRSRGRTVVAAVLVALGALLAPVALTAVWLHQEVSDTERFVATMSPLISQPSVQATLTDRVTDAIVDHLDVGDAANQTADALAAQGLPRRASEALRGLAAPLESGLRDFVHTRVGDLLSGDQAAEAWQKAISAAHTAATAVLSGTAPAVSVQGDDVVVDLAPLVDAAKQRLVADGLILADRVPE